MTPTQHSPVIAITGGSGAIATSLRPHLAKAGYQVRLIDIVGPQDALQGNEELKMGSVDELAFMTQALAGVDAVIHLGGIHREKPWHEICSTNITGTYVTLEAAHRQGITKALIASSTHAVGFTPTVNAQLDTVLTPRPDSLYGVSKVAMEALGSLYSDKYGMKVISVRIGTGGMTPTNVRSQSTWISSGDTFRIVEALLDDNNMGTNSIIWGVSKNTYGWANLDAGKRVGYSPADNALAYWEGDLESLEAPRTGDDLLLGGFWTSDDHVIGIDNYP